jgi:2-oxoglutarate ferredoxin oxidoreductase subunit gamma
MSKTKSTKRHCEEIFCAGFGGQGIMFMGKLLAQAGLAAGKYVTWMPSYGAEVRGGAAYSMVKISDAEIASPLVANPTILIAMNKPSLVKYEGKLNEGAMLLANTSLIDNIQKIKGVTTVKVPMTGIASRLGETKCTNMVAIGAMLKKSKVISMRNVVNALKEAFANNEKLFTLNKEALQKGYKAV